ncbi:hypothetical protein BC830DRAFT_1088972 [Chytriomyces sp. MP71]|nr:hypothetical protein BC830DRAFT_1088972 [Chytriomyces sp. MP71]
MDYEALFADVAPVLHDDGPNPISPIAYPAEYSAAMDYFRACARVDERSQRVLDLTAVIIDLNPAHYTVWKVRQDCLFATGTDLRKELAYATEVGLEHHKNYQVWHHREVVVTQLAAAAAGQGSGIADVIATELAYINQQLDADSKNYHAWSYRQWLVRHFQHWDQELPDVDGLIVTDCRNNSAWNHRFFVYSNRPGGMSAPDLAAELQYCKKYIKLAPNNESPWNYLKGILKKFNSDLAVQDQLEDDVRNMLNEEDFVVHGASFLLTMTEARLARSSISDEERLRLVAEASQLCKELMEQDVIRVKFWSYRLSLLPLIP